MKMMRYIVLMAIGLVFTAAPSYAATWFSSKKISTSGQTSYASQVAMNASANAVAVWVASATHNLAKASIRTGASNTWSTPVTLSTTTADAGELQVAMNSAGDAIAVWMLIDGSNTTIQAATYTASTHSWGSPSNLSSSGDYVFAPRVTFNDSGKAIVIWLRETNEVPNDVVQGRIYSSGSWGSSFTLSDTAEQSFEAQLFLSNNGNGLVVWTTDDDFGGHIESVSYDGSSFGTILTLSTSEVPAGMPQVVMNASGDGVACWKEFVSGEHRATVAFYTSGSWESANLISASGDSIEEPKIGFNDDGNACLIWSAYNESTNKNVIRGMTYINGSWSSEVNISDTSIESFSPQVQMNNNGYSVVAWDQLPSSGYRVQVVVNASGTWGSITTLESNLNTVGDIHVDINDNGYMIALWTRDFGTPEIRTSRGTV